MHNKKEIIAQLVKWYRQYGKLLTNNNIYHICHVLNNSLTLKDVSDIQASYYNEIERGDKNDR
jgi:hypothetical protein